MKSPKSGTATNIHDRVIAATALAYDCPLITKDKTLSLLPPLKTVW